MNAESSHNVSLTESYEELSMATERLSLERVRGKVWQGMLGREEKYPLNYLYS